MKKMLRKFLKSSSKPPETGGRITNETVAEHREKVLAGGRKFKYPLQYTKRRVLIISILLTVLAAIFFVAFFAWSLYFAQSYDKFTYGLTRVLPVPVAKIDNEWVRYSDYLSGLRSAVHYLTTKEAANFNSADGKRQLEYQKRLALDKAIEDTMITHIATENHITVSDKEVDDFVQQQIAPGKLGVSIDVYKQVIRDYYDWSFDEYKSSVRQEILNKKVMAALDVAGKQKIQGIQDEIAKGADFAAIAKSESEDAATKAFGGDVGFVSKSSDDPSGLIAAASGLQINQISNVIQGADGFYLVKLLEKRDNGDVHFAKIFIPYKVVAQRLADFKKAGKIHEFIKVDQLNQPISQ